MGCFSSTWKSPSKRFFKTKKKEKWRKTRLYSQNVVMAFSFSLHASGNIRCQNSFVTKFLKSLSLFSLKKKRKSLPNQLNSNKQKHETNTFCSFLALNAFCCACAIRWIYVYRVYHNNPLHWADFFLHHLRIFKEKCQINTYFLFSLVLIRLNGSSMEYTYSIHRTKFGTLRLRLSAFIFVACIGITGLRN